MRRFFHEFIQRYSRFMQGRYGYDELGRFLIFTALALTLLGYIPKLRILSLFGLAVLIYYLFRIYSKNHTARQMELNRYYVISDKVKKEIRLIKSKWRDRKTHVYFKCKNCGAIVRVPKNKGEIEVTCPRCRAKTTKKT